MVLNHFDFSVQGFVGFMYLFVYLFVLRKELLFDFFLTFILRSLKIAMQLEELVPRGNILHNRNRILFHLFL